MATVNRATLEVTFDFVPPLETPEHLTLAESSELFRANVELALRLIDDAPDAPEINVSLVSVD